MFVFGSEEDTVQVLRDTVDFSHEIDIDSLQYLILTPIVGTPIYEELASQNRLLHHDWQYYDGHHAVFVPRYMTPFELQSGDLAGHEAVLYLAFSPEKAVAGRLVLCHAQGARPSAVATFL